MAHLIRVDDSGLSPPQIEKWSDTHIDMRGTSGPTVSQINVNTVQLETTTLTASASTFQNSIYDPAGKLDTNFWRHFKEAETFYISNF